MQFLISLLRRCFYGVRIFYARFTYFIKVIKKFCFSSDGNNSSFADVQQYEGCVIYIQKVHNYSQRFYVFVCEKQKLKLNR